MKESVKLVTFSSANSVDRSDRSLHGLCVLRVCDLSLYYVFHPTGATHTHIEERSQGVIYGGSSWVHGMDGLSGYRRRYRDISGSGWSISMFVTGTIHPSGVRD